MTVCGRGHTIDGPRDRLNNGQCRYCHRKDLRTHSARRTFAMFILKQMEAAGLRESDLRETDGYAIALKWLNSADHHEMARLENEHPALFSKFAHQLVTFANS